MEIQVHKQPEPEVEIRNVTAHVFLDFTLYEGAQDLLNGFVEGEVHWGDGEVVAVTAQPSPAHVSLQHDFHPGSYVITILAHNFRAPVQEADALTIPIIARLPAPVIEQPPIVFGPIIPRDQGAPNRSQWALDLANNIRVLESDIRVLLLTPVGTRLMQPDYGTQLNRLVFEPFDEPVIRDFAAEDIRRALTTWEPRAQLTSLTLTKINERSVALDCKFTTKLSPEGFTVNLQFSQS